VLFGLSLDPQGCSGLRYLVDESFCLPRFEILWFRLSEMEVLVWSIILGASTGALLGLLVDRLSRGWEGAPRTRRGIGTVVAVSLLALVSCTGSEVQSKRPPSQASFRPLLLLRIRDTRGSRSQQVAPVHLLLHAEPSRPPHQHFSRVAWRSGPVARGGIRCSGVLCPQGQRLLRHSVTRSSGRSDRPLFGIPGPMASKPRRSDGVQFLQPRMGVGAALVFPPTTCDRPLRPTVLPGWFLPPTKCSADCPMCEGEEAGVGIICSARVPIERL
jgi:hypothetical protein